MTASPTDSRAPVSPAARTALAWAVVFAGSLVAAAALAPFVHAALRALDLPAGWTFSRVFNRVAMAAALAALIGFRRWAGWREVFALLSRARPAAAAAQAAGGLVAALLAVGLGVAWAFAAARLEPGLVPFAAAPGRMVKLLAGAAVAASIEEIFFRGLMLGSLAARWRWTAAALTTSALYSAVHLLSPDRKFAPQGLDPGAGFHYLGHLSTGQLEPAVLPPLAGLYLTGLVLALVVRRTGTLWVAIGLHAGWAFAFQVLRQATHVPHPIPGRSTLATIHFLVGTPWAWAAIALAGGLVFAAAALNEKRRAGRGRFVAERG